MMDDGLHAANQIRQNSQTNSGIIVTTKQSDKTVKQIASFENSKIRRKYMEYRKNV
jgi:CheY-like chemotaxis protein